MNGWSSTAVEWTSAPLKTFSFLTASKMLVGFLLFKRMYFDTAQYRFAFHGLGVVRIWLRHGSLLILFIFVENELLVLFSLRKVLVFLKVTLRQDD